MRRRFLQLFWLSLVGVLALCPFSLTAGGADDKKDEKGKAESADDKRAKEYAAWKQTFFAQVKETAKGKNGVRLEASAEVKQGAIHLKWTLHYFGPRSPLIILKPTLYLTTGQTKVVFFAENQAQTIMYEWELESTNSTGAHPFSPWSPKEFFITVPKDKPASGTIVIPLEKVASSSKKVLPENFVARESYLQIVHQPFDRGEGGGSEGLDAWTGEVHSPLLKYR